MYGKSIKIVYVDPIHTNKTKKSVPEGEDALSGEGVQAEGVDALLVEDDEALALVVAAHLALELDDLLDAVVDELPLGLDELLPVLGRLVEEARVNLRLLVLHADVAGEDVAVLERLGHVGVPPAVVHDDALHQLRVGLGSVLHLHDLDHVQVAVFL